MSRPKIAAIVTEYRRYCHAQHILDRFLIGYGFNARHHRPEIDLVSLYTDQTPESDLSRPRAEEFPGMKIYPTIAEALTLGGSQLAVDGVLIVGEHGDYPKNEKGQTLYPRYEFFKEIEAVFRASGRSVPVFNDKHLSYRWDYAAEMVEVSRELGFPFMAGSSVPVTSRTPAIEMPLGSPIEEAIGIGPGGVDSYDIHVLEIMQCLVERRRGGESGVKAVHALRGDAVWDAMEAGSFDAGGWNMDLFYACLARSHNLNQLTEDDFNHRAPEPHELRQYVDPKKSVPVAYRIECNDGLKMTMFLIGNVVKDFDFAARITGRPDPWSVGFILHPREICNFFSPFVHHIETMIHTGRPPYPIERTLLTTGTVAACVDSLHQGQVRLETPHLNVTYQPNPDSTFWRPAPGDAVSRYKTVTPTVRTVPPHDGKRKKIAIIATILKHRSHAQHIGDRFMVGYPRNGQWHHPDMDVVALYVDRKPDNDLSAARAKEFGFTVYPTIAETLRCGGDKLAVDAVVVIAEHGDYQKNDKGQVLYPRHDFFKQVVDVFEADGRAVPVFNDKHLSYSFEKATDMVETARRIGFPLTGGSSLPLTWRLPAIELPLECEIDEALAVGCGSSDAMDYHALEAMQCMIERRRGGETGVRAVQLIDGDAVWKAGDAGEWSYELLEAALACSDHLKGQSAVDARTQDLVRNGELPKIVENPAAYIIEFNDGLHATLLMLNGAVGDFTFAARVKGFDRIQATQFYIASLENVTYSACLVANAEHMIETGAEPFPIERNQLVCGILDRCLDSRQQDNQRIETPELNVHYKVADAPPFIDVLIHTA